jgi:hypothetical protein
VNCDKKGIDRFFFFLYNPDSRKTPHRAGVKGRGEPSEPIQKGQAGQSRKGTFRTIKAKGENKMVFYWMEETADGWLIMGYHKGFKTTRPIKLYATKKAAEKYLNKVNHK